MADYAPVSTLNNGAAAQAGGSAGLSEPLIWKNQVISYEKNEDFYAPIEGNGANSIVLTETATGDGHGLKVRIRVDSELSNEPHYGDQTFASDTDFERVLYGEYDLNVDVIRHAVSYNKRFAEISALRGELEDKLPAKLGRWLGRRKTEEMDMEIVNRTPDANHFYPSSKTESQLGAADGLTWDYIMNVSSAMSNLGGVHGKLGTFNGSPIHGFALVTSHPAGTALRQDATYRQILRDAGDRGGANHLFKGSYPLIDGVQIIDRRVIDMDYEGAIGSVLNPKALLGTAITAGTTTFDVTGGGNATSGAITTKLFFRMFEGYAYKFASGVTLAPSASKVKYLLIRNPLNAPTDPGKFGMYSYTTGNNGNKITILQRLGSAASGARVTTLGAVTWNTGVWNGLHTDVHPSGAEIYPCNAKGEPLGVSLLLGRGAVLRGYGMNRLKRTQAEGDMEFLKMVGIEAWFGQTIRKDRLGRAPGVAVLHHAIHYPWLGLPTIV